MAKGAFKQADVTRALLGAIDAMERRGLSVKAVRVSLSGEITVLTEGDTPDVAANDAPLNLVALAGKKTIPRA